MVSWHSPYCFGRICSNLPSLPWQFAMSSGTSLLRLLPNLPSLPWQFAMSPWYSRTGRLQRLNVLGLASSPLAWPHQWHQF